ncbi:MAG: MGMT family protein [Akkermansia muciniphila]
MLEILSAGTWRKGTGCRYLPRQKTGWTGFCRRQASDSRIASGSRRGRAVWKILCGIPYGEVATYGEIARKMAARGNKRSMSAQAVGGAVAHNPISIIIPCHRVVGSGGSLTGYACGIDAKIRLLELEGADMSRLFMPRKGTAL